MFYLGIVPKFKVNRPLLQEEKANHLPVDEALNIEPTSALSVTRMNSTFLEVTDKFYPWKGTAAALGLAIFFLGLFFTFAISYTVFLMSWKEHCQVKWSIFLLMLLSSS